MLSGIALADKAALEKEYEKERLKKHKKASVNCLDSDRVAALAPRACREPLRACALLRAGSVPRVAAAR